MRLCGEHKLILSGTPVENKLEDLWSLMNFVQPGLLGDLTYFVNTYCNKIIKGTQKNSDHVEKIAANQMVQEIHGRLSNHILRRTKQQLEGQITIPEKNEYIVRCYLTKEQLDVYENYLEDALELMEKKDQQAVAYVII